MTVPVLLVASGEAWEPNLVRALQSRNSNVVLVRRSVDLADAVATAASGVVRAVLVGMDAPGLDTDVVSRLREARVEPVLIGDPQQSGLSLRAAQLGISWVLDWQEVDQLPTLLDKVHLAPVGSGSPSDPLERVREQPGRLLAVWGPTGAPGRSTVALGVAAELAAGGVSTLVIDADVYGGAIASMLAMLDEVSGVLAAARLAGTGSLDPTALSGLIRRVAPGLGVLTGVSRADRWPQLRPGSFAGVLSTARELAAVVVVDCGFCLEADEELSFDTAAPRRNGATLLALERADEILAVGSADPLGLARLARGYVDLQEAVPGAAVRLVVNRMRPSLGWRSDEVGETLRRFTGQAPISFIPNDPNAVDRAWLAGHSLVEGSGGSALRRALADLATSATGYPLSSAGSPRRGRFGSGARVGA